MIMSRRLEIHLQKSAFTDSHRSEQMFLPDLSLHLLQLVEYVEISEVLLYSKQCSEQAAWYVVRHMLQASSKTCCQRVS